MFNKSNNRRQKQHQQQTFVFVFFFTTTAAAASLLFFLLLFASTIAVVDGFIIIPPSSSSSKFSSPPFNNKAATTTTTLSTTQQTSSSSSSVLFGQLSWSGDSNASMEWINAPIELVQEFLQSSESDIPLMGTTEDAKLICEEQNIWDVTQPQIQFLGLNLIPIFVNQVQRYPPESVIVSITDAKTQLDKSSSSSIANRAVASILEKSKFVGKSRIRATARSSSSTTTTTTSTSTIVTVDLDLTLQVPLPKFVLLPPGFNTIGSTIIGQTGKSRTKKLLINLERDYQKWVSFRNNNNNDNEEENKHTTVNNK